MTRFQPIRSRSRARPTALLVRLSPIWAIIFFIAAACNDDASEPAPDFELALFASADHAEGESLSLSALDGRPVVLNFWFPSCPPCVAEMPDLESAYQKYKADGVGFIGVQLLGLDTAEDGRNFVRKLDLGYALGPDEDGDISRKYGVTGFPTTVFIDTNHRIARMWTGALDLEKLEEFIEEIL